MDRITHIDVFAQWVPWHPPYALSMGRTIEGADHTFVRLRTARGLEGWGEAAFAGRTYTEAFGEGARAGLGAIAPALLGCDAAQPATVHATITRTLAGHPYVRSGIDMALWDIAGRRYGVPVWMLLGGMLSKAFPMAASIAVMPAPAMRERVLALRADGYTQYSAKLEGDTAEDLARAAEAAALIQPDETLTLDANRGLSLLEATRIANAMEGTGVLLEQLCWGYEEMRALRGRTSLPFVLDECIVTPRELYRAAHEGVADVIKIKLSRVGGVSAAKHIIDVCAACGIRTCVQECAGSEIAGAAIAHLAAATPPATLLGVWYPPAVNDCVFAGTDAVLDRGAVRLAGTRPGLGVEPDMATLGAPIASCTL